MKSFVSVIACFLSAAVVRPAVAAWVAVVGAACFGAAVCSIAAAVEAARQAAGAGAAVTIVASPWQSAGLFGGFYGVLAGMTFGNLRWSHPDDKRRRGDGVYGV